MSSYVKTVGDATGTYQAGDMMDLAMSVTKQWAAVE